MSRQKLKDRILILDAETRSALAVVRALSSFELELSVVANSKWAITAGSKFVDIIFKSPSPASSPKEYLEFLIELVKTYKPKLLIPTTDISLNLCYQIEEELAKCTIFPFPKQTTYEAVNNKQNLLNLAKAYDLNIPRTILIPEFSKRTPEDISAIKDFSYPAVLKPCSSASFLNNQFIKNKFIKPKVYYPDDAEEALLQLNPSFDQEAAAVNYLLQEKISGTGTGVFALCKKGEPYALFAHQRILEKPPSGGVSVLSESIPLEDTPWKESLALLKPLPWDGIAMLEFKKDLTGKSYLLEINPRFWGSLQLAVNSGINFPVLLYKLFCRETFSLQNTYQLNQRLRWELGNLDHLFIKFKSSPLKTLKQIFKKNLLEFFAKNKNTKNEIMHFNDSKPFIYEIINAFLIKK